ncbi:MAG: hypothetical protein MUC90_07465 [Thermoplasmata archaeon]|nr:hypothetical protein [Thermoplasmata archaeon]
MRHDDAAVGGFFEDLPVLVLVLCGVAAIVSASVWSSGQIADEQSVRELDEIAQRFVDRLVEAALQVEGGGYPSVDKLRVLNISRLAMGLPKAIGYAVSIVEIYPSLEWLLQYVSDGKPISTDASASIRLVNAIDPWSRIVIVEARVIVW